MKKKIKTLLAIIPLLALTGCDVFNEQIVDTSWSFDKVHLVSAEKCYKIKSWKNFEDGDMVQVQLDDETKMLGHSNELILINGNCPYCNK